MESLPLPVSLTDLEFHIAYLLTPLVILVLALSVGKIVVALVTSLSAMFVFKAKGYRVHQVVEVNGEPAAITKIGLWSTHFLILNGGNKLKFLAVSNPRLDFLTVHRLVHKHQADINEVENGGI